MYTLIYAINIFYIKKVIYKRTDFNKNYQLNMWFRPYISVGNTYTYKRCVGLIRNLASQNECVLGFWNKAKRNPLLSKQRKWRVRPFTPWRIVQFCPSGDARAREKGAVYTSVYTMYKLCVVLRYKGYVSRPWDRSHPCQCEYIIQSFWEISLTNQHA